MDSLAHQLDALRTTVEDFRGHLPTVELTGKKLAATLAGGGKIMTCGNGGSACDALHLTEELVGRFDKNRRSLAALCLCADAPLLTCIANDFGYDTVFARQIEGLGRAGDALVIFTTSGNSANLVAALQLVQIDPRAVVGVAHEHDFVARRMEARRQRDERAVGVEAVREIRHALRFDTVGERRDPKPLLLAHKTDASLSYQHRS